MAGKKANIRLMITDFARSLADEYEAQPLDPSEATFFTGILQRKVTNKKKKKKKARDISGIGMCALGSYFYQRSRNNSE